MTFEKWLSKQRKRNDLIGELAIEFYYAMRLSAKNDAKCDEKYLHKWDAAGKFYIALKEARVEYEVSL